MFSLFGVGCVWVNVPDWYSHLSSVFPLCSLLTCVYQEARVSASFV